MTGFNVSAVKIYWVGLSVILLAFVLSWFFKVPPLRQRSALQEQADDAGTADDLEVAGRSGRRRDGLAHRARPPARSPSSGPVGEVGAPGPPASTAGGPDLAPGDTT